MHWKRELRRAKMKGRYFVGILLILIGTGFLGDQLGYLDFGDIISTYWSVIIIIAGLAGLFDRGSSKLGSLIVISIGVIFQLSRLDMITRDVFKYFFPVVLILIGGNLIFSKGAVSSKSGANSENWNKNRTNEDFVDHTVLMSGIENINTSQSFKGGKLTAIMGGIELDLRDANMEGTQCYIEATAIAGGVEIHVPRHWRVEAQGTPVLGAFTNKAVGPVDPTAPLLIVKGTAIMGGVEIN
jgi:predicted membrane protein